VHESPISGAKADMNSNYKTFISNDVIEVGEEPVELGLFITNC
jgi:hypothetical protein